MYYNVHTYQQSILSEMGTLIAEANVKANPGGVNVAPQSVVDHLKAAVKVRARYGRCWWNHMYSQRNLGRADCAARRVFEYFESILSVVSCVSQIYPCVAFSTGALRAVIPMISSSLEGKQKQHPLLV